MAMDRSMRYMYIIATERPIVIQIRYMAHYIYYVLHPWPWVGPCSKDTYAYPHGYGWAHTFKYICGCHGHVWAYALNMYVCCPCPWMGPHFKYISVSHGHGWVYAPNKYMCFPWPWMGPCFKYISVCLMAMCGPMPQINICISHCYGWAHAPNKKGLPMAMDGPTLYTYIHMTHGHEWAHAPINICVSHGHGWAHTVNICVHLSYGHGWAHVSHMYIHKPWSLVDPTSQLHYLSAVPGLALIKQAVI